MYTIEQMKEAYEAYCAEHEYEWGERPAMTFEQFKAEQETEGYWRCDAYLSW